MKKPLFLFSFLFHAVLGTSQQSTRDNNSTDKYFIFHVGLFESTNQTCDFFIPIHLSMERTVANNVKKNNSGFGLALDYGLSHRLDEIISPNKSLSGRKVKFYTLKSFYAKGYNIVSTKKLFLTSRLKANLFFEHFSCEPVGNLSFPIRSNHIGLELSGELLSIFRISDIFSFSLSIETNFSHLTYEKFNIENPNIDPRQQNQTFINSGINTRFVTIKFGIPLSNRKNKQTRKSNNNRYKLKRLK